MRDLTNGSELKHIVFFSMPLLLGNIFQQLYSTVDRIVVGNFVGKDALAAVGASFPILFLLIGFIIGITMGITVLISQYWGAKNHEKVRSTIETGIIFLFFASVALTILGLLLTKPILRLIQTPKEVFAGAVIYLNITFAGLVPLFGYNTLSAILRGLGDSKTPFYFLVLATVLNIILDIIFVVFFKWGIAGAAWATIISQTVSFILAYYYLTKKYELFRFSFKKMTFDKEIFQLSLKIGIPNGLQQIIVAAGIATLMGIVNSYGSSFAAAFTIGGTLDSFAMLPAMSLSMALTTFTGQNIGANKLYRVKRGFYTTALLGFMIAISISFIIFIFRHEIIALFTKEADVINLGADYILYISMFYSLFTLMFVVNGLLRGAGDTIMPLISSILALWVFRIPVALLLSKKIGIFGVWYSIPIGWFIGVLSSFLYYLSGKWKTKTVVKYKHDLEQ